MELREIKKHFRSSGLTHVRLVDANGSVIVPWPTPRISDAERWKEIEVYLNSPVVEQEGHEIQGKIAARSKGVQRFPVGATNDTSIGEKNTPPEALNDNGTVKLLMEVQKELTEVKARLFQLEEEFAQAVEEAASLEDVSETPSIIESTLIPAGITMLDRFLSVQEAKHGLKKTEQPKKDSDVNT